MPRPILDLQTPCLLLDADRMEANIARLRARMVALGVALRPHVKTCKCLEGVRAMLGATAGPITVSTLREAEWFHARGFVDILYAVGLAPAKLDRVLALRAAGCDLTVLVDSLEVAQATAGRGAGIPALVEIDCDGRRAGVAPEDPALIDIAAALSKGADPRGVMTHAGGSYQCRGAEAIRAMAERERRAAVEAASRLRAAGFAAPVVSVGSTPTATFAERLEGVTEVRAGVFLFQDLVMTGLGVCALEDLALSVLVTVIGHRQDRGWALTDGGWMALSRDRGTAGQPLDQGYGLVCDEAGEPLAEVLMVDATQEHGVLAGRGSVPLDLARFPLGARLRILPNHACATAAQHEAYQVLRGGARAARWERCGGW